MGIPKHLEHGLWDFIISHASQVPSMTWMPTWQHCLEARLGTCAESLVEQKVMYPEIFCVK